MQSTKRHAEGTAVGYNKENKGARSYYPLFCTIAQTGQVLDVLHRSGNVHDSKGALEFVTACVQTVRERLGNSVRLEHAWTALEQLGVEYSISVPFERFSALKGLIEKRKLWWSVPGLRRQKPPVRKPLESTELDQEEKVYFYPQYRWAAK